ncbi:MAG: hypothetical protein QOH72_2456 [Solirubrobacteraceae bacterium]|nr:hypothetical protein [Solirubrobacteraceae bacterium]
MIARRADLDEHLAAGKVLDEFLGGGRERMTPGLAAAIAELGAARGTMTGPTCSSSRRPRPPRQMARPARNPIEVARKALREAAVLEWPPLRDVLLRLADGLPSRERG